MPTVGHDEVIFLVLVRIAFYSITSPSVPAPTVGSRSGRSAGVCHHRVWARVEKPNHGNGAVPVENGQQEGRADCRPFFAAERVILCRYISAKQVGR